jgi:hypothetical protein
LIALSDFAILRDDDHANLRMPGVEDPVIYHDVEGMEHRIGPQTLNAIEALIDELKSQRKLLSRIRLRAHGS